MAQAEVETGWQLNSVVNGIGQHNGVLQYWVDGVLRVVRCLSIGKAGHLGRGLYKDGNHLTLGPRRSVN